MSLLQYKIAVCGGGGVGKSCLVKNKAKV
jgi:GTPase KRas